MGHRRRLIGSVASLRRRRAGVARRSLRSCGVSEFWITSVGISKGEDDPVAPERLTVVAVAMRCAAWPPTGGRPKLELKHQLHTSAAPAAHEALTRSSHSELQRRSQPGNRRDARSPNPLKILMRRLRILATRSRASTTTATSTAALRSLVRYRPSLLSFDAERLKHGAPRPLNTLVSSEKTVTRAIRASSRCRLPTRPIF